MVDPGSDPRHYLFGPCRLDPARRVLWQADRRIQLSPRMLDALLCLVRNPELPVSRQDLMRAIWGTRIVEECNLKQTIYELRKLLGAEGERLIATVPQQGYRLTVPVCRAAAPGLDATTVARPARRALAAAGLAAATLAALLWRSHAGLAPPPHSIAVLPFTNASGDPAQAYFSDGISAELIADLARIGAVHVAARTSSFALRGPAATIPDIARQLHVGVVLEGSVARQGAHVHLTAELVDAASGFAIWSHSYDSETVDLLDAQAAIAASVAGSLRVALLGGEAAPASLGGTRDAAAFDFYLRGMKLARGAQDLPTVQAACAAFEQAIARDPGFALARGNRAHELALDAELESGVPPEHVQQIAQEALREADRALALAPDLPIAHLARSNVMVARQDFAGAQAEMARARSAAPGDVQVLMDDVFLEVSLGHSAAALADAERGVELDPLSPASYITLADAQRGLRRYDDALASLHRARLLGGDDAIAIMEAAIALARGEDDAAQRTCAQGTGWQNDLCLAIAEQHLGRQAEALFHFAALRAALGANGAFQYAEVYAQWRQPEEAFRWLDIAYRTHDAGLIMLRSDVLLDPIRGTPQYAAIERRLHFPP